RYMLCCTTGARSPIRRHRREGSRPLGEREGVLHDSALRRLPDRARPAEEGDEERPPGRAYGRLAGVRAAPAGGGVSRTGSASGSIAGSSPRTATAARTRAATAAGGGG